MKKTFRLLSFFLSLVMLIGVLPMSAFAISIVVPINSTNFPDEIFREEYVRTYDTNGNGHLSSTEIAAVTRINCSRKGITSLKGIEIFTSLKYLYCYYNQLTGLDVSKNTALIELECYGNQLTSLNVRSNTALLELLCFNNLLTSLDVSKNTALTLLRCEGNQLTGLDVSSNTKLERLSCYDNQLTSLNVSQNTALKNLDCEDNQLTSLDVSQNTALEYLYCSRNQLTSLDVRSNTALTEFWCAENQLASLDVRSNIALETFLCNDNQLTSLNVRSNTALTTLHCYTNQLTNLDLSQNAALQSLSCYGNQLTSLDVSKNTALKYLYCYNNQLTNLDLSNNTALRDWAASDNGTQITVNPAGTFNLSSLPGFDVSKASNWVGGTVKGNILTVNSGATKVTYDYNTGMGTVSFFLNVKVQSGQLAKPVLSSVSNAATGVTVKWGAVSGAAQYRVFYKTGSGNWVKAGDTTGTSFTVTGLTSGKKYTFTVRCLSADGKSYTSSYDTTGKSITYVAQPAISSLTNTSTGVTVKWGAITGAAKYRVYYKTGSGSWVKAGDTTGTSLTATGLTKGTAYTFTVKVFASDGTASSYDATGKTITHNYSTQLAKPVLSSVANGAKGVTVKWNAVSGAAKYRVFYKTGSGSWVKAGDTTGTSYTVTGLTSGKKYSFTVRCLSADGKTYTSSYDTTGKSITYVAQPAISSLTNTSTGVTVKWGAITGAAKYRVYYQTGSGSWVKAGDTTGTSLTATGLTKGTAYTFTVKAFASDGTASSYDATGKAITYSNELAKPVLSSVSNAATGVTVKWGAVSGAAKYRVFYKTDSGSWVKAGDTTGTSFTVTGLTSGTKYSFTVRCLSADGKSYTSSYDTTGKSITYVAQPTISSLTNTSTGVTVKWGAITGAAKYRVFYKTGSGSWVKAGDTTGTSLTVKGLTKGTKYTFTVRCLDANGNYVSSYDATGKSITYQ